MLTTSLADGFILCQVMNCTPDEGFETRKLLAIYIYVCVCVSQAERETERERERER